ncbi:hypothetical protein EMN47_07225 [Prolixibacteraceae bacterium JC049]|nr:hypothetical protein [Prolixibacteraceae bacterium JC049]
MTFRLTKRNMNINPRHLNNLFVRFWKAELMLLVIVILCLIPSSQLPKNVPIIPHLDKVVHFLMYFSIMLLLIQPMHLTFTNKSKALTISFILGISLGILVEVAQHFTLTRSANIYDALANTAGLVVAALLFPILTRSAFFRWCLYP